jgi:DNA-binding beta-propeller fold protein YncE
MPIVRLAAVGLTALALASGALAGGDFVDLAVTRSAVWFVGQGAVRGLSPVTGEVVASPALPRAAYPLSVATAGNAVWVASVENGFVEGRLSRIDSATLQVRVVLRVPAGSVQYVAAGAGAVYALVGLKQGNEIVRFALAGRRDRTWRIADAGRMTADASGCWVSGNGRLVHLDPQGRMHVIHGIGFGDVTAGGGAVWVALRDSIVRVDERTGATRVLRTGPLHLGGFQHDVAVTDDALWTLDSLRPRLEKRDLRTGRLVASARLPAVPDAVVPKPGGVWVAVAVSHRVLRFDARTLRRTLAVAVD